MLSVYHSRWYKPMRKSHRPSPTGPTNDSKSKPENSQPCKELIIPIDDSEPCKKPDKNNSEPCKKPIGTVVIIRIMFRTFLSIPTYVCAYFIN